MLMGLIVACRNQSEVGISLRHIKAAMDIIAKAGFEEITVFENQEPRFVTIAGGIL